MGSLMDGAAAPLPIAEPAEVGLSAVRLDRLRRRFKAEADAERLPGGVLMVARRGRLAYSDCFGHRDPIARVPMAIDALFRIFSMTKPLTSVAALMLVETGDIQLSDPVAAYLPALASLKVSMRTPNDAPGGDRYGTVPAARPVTIHDLMIHASGLVYGARCANIPVRDAYARLGIPLNPRAIAADEYVARIAAAPLAHQPGTVWEYGGSTDLLGAVIEAVTGRRLGEFLAERLFLPLRMADSGFTVPAGAARRIAQPFARDPVDGSVIDTPDQTFDPLEPARLDSGGAGAVSTASDYCRFAQMLLNGGALDGVRVLARNTIEWMTADHLCAGIAVPLSPGESAMGSPGYGFGLGVAVRRSDGRATVPGYAGAYFWSGTAGTLFWVDPRAELVAVFMTQAPGASRQHYRRLAMQLVYQAIDD